MEKKLINKKVEIKTESFGSHYASSPYNGVVLSIYQDGHCTFIELDSGELINTKYITCITIIE